MSKGVIYIIWNGINEEIDKYLLLSKPILMNL